LKLLFDANLSPRLVPRLAELFPGSIHVFDTDLVRYTPDEVIWEYAKNGGYTIVTADSDFIEIAKRQGTPPGVVRLENCNYKTALVEEVIRRNAVRITDAGLRGVLIL
jgi:predicted nuclease of predicted toxin-antitoxin system